MKVLLINGSPHKNGSTYTALAACANTLEKSGIETEIFYIGTAAVYGCTGCRSCAKTGKCVYDDAANVIAAKLDEIDGLVLGSPVYYASSNGGMNAVLDRVFYMASGKLWGKPGAAIASARRAGTTATLDQLNKYFAFSGMPVVSSCYWNMIHGNSSDEAREDLEGINIVEALGTNMAWLLKCIDTGKRSGISLPPVPEKIRTNFIR